MDQAKDSVNLTENNKRSLEKLARTLRLTGGRRFELVLARSNYTPLRDKILQLLYQQSEVSIHTLELPKTARQLYTRIQQSFADQTPEALCIVGLESVEKLEELLLSTNQVREEFRKNFGFPIVIWVTDDILGEIIRLVPDFHNWATPITFEYAANELVDLLQERSKKLFQHILESATEYPAEETVLTSAWNAQEIKEYLKAKEELEFLNYQLSQENLATLKLCIGREDYRSNQFNNAVTKYQYCLHHWQALNDKRKQGIVQFHLGLCHKRKSELELNHVQNNLQKAETYFKQCLASFNSANRSDLVACFIGQLGEVLLRLKQWNNLKVLTDQSLKLHRSGQSTANNARLARDYGFLSQISLHNNDWEAAQSYAEQALQSIQLAPVSQRKHRAFYQLARAQALQEQGQLTEAATCSKEARQTLRSLSDPILCISILKQLRKLFIAQHNYLSAFETKQEQRSLESQYGLRAFIGASRLQPSRQLGSSILGDSNLENVAQEISVSDRQRDIDKLVNRISRDNFKLTIIHGQSGVGKSSTVRAGLIPTLRDRIIKTRDVLTITLQYYNDWIDDLGRQLCDNLNRHEEDVTNPLDSGASVLAQLRQNQYRYISVLILDQFEEFFIGHSNQEERKSFLQFLSHCFKIPYTKVIIVMREDYLHYLLEFEHLATDDYYITNDILSANHRYEIGNFSPEDAKAIIQSLTERTQFHLEPKLVDTLVNDLAGDIQQVRPIELQIVGAQLQTEGITKLDEYHEKGPKSSLVQRYLEEVIKDCGPENQQAANLVLYLLTDENETRPPKTRDELESALRSLARNLATEANKLDLVLQIFVKSGLVFLLPSLPASRYQLVHDYLVSYIRRQQTPRISELTAKLEEERERRQATEIQKQKIEQQRDAFKEINKKLEAEKAQRRKTEIDLQQAKRLFRRVIIASTIAIGTAITLVSIDAHFKYQDVSLQSEKAELERESLQMLQQVESDPLSSLVNAMEYVQRAKKLVRDKSSNSTSTYSPYYVLQQVLHEIRAINQIHGHEGPVHKAIFRPNKDELLTTSRSGTAHLWNMQGEKLVEFPASQTPIIDVSFSQDGQTIATASADNIVKIWNPDGHLIQELPVEQQESRIRSISLSPDNQYIAIVSIISADREADIGITQLWKLGNRHNNPITLSNQNKPIFDVSFNPEGTKIATTSSNGKVELWDLTGNKIQTLSNGSTADVLDITFDTTGQFFATASADGNAHIWSVKDGSSTSFDHEGQTLLGVSFSADRKYLATAAADQTARVWDLETGQQVHKLKGHSNQVLSVSFNTDPQKSHILATSSEDGSVLTWDISDKKVAGFTKKDNNTFRTIQFSPTGKHLVAGAVDGSLYIWDFTEQNSPLLIDQMLDKATPASFNLHERQINSVHFSRDGKLVASGSADGSIVIFDIFQKKINRRIKFDKPTNIWDIDFNPNKKHIASVNASDGTVRIWDLDGNLVESRLSTNDKALHTVKYNDDGTYIAAGGASGQVTVWDDNKNKVLQDFEVHSSPILDLIFTPDNKYLVTASADESIVVIDLTAQKEPRKIIVKNFRAHTDSILDIEISSKNQMIATASEDGNVKLWSINEGLADIRKQLFAEYSYNEAVRSIRFSPDESHLLITSDNGQTDMWEIDSTLDSLLDRGCQWLKDFSYNRPEVEKALTVCSATPIASKKVP
ncbi:hypothetical protein SPB21_23835 [Leptothoe sp. ISB3NOV94-8A]